MARDFDRQFAEIQIRIAVLKRYTALGITFTETIALIRLGSGRERPTPEFFNKTLTWANPTNNYDRREPVKTNAIFKILSQFGKYKITVTHEAIASKTVPYCVS